LSITVPEGPAAFLLSQTELIDKVVGRNGFRQAEHRTCMGGTTWRRFEPTQPQRAYGLAYESWEFSGPPGAWAADALRDKPGKPSRVDWAFDLYCPRDVTPAHFREQTRAHFEEAGFKPSWKGGEEDGTFYLGSPTSVRRMKVYRKDLQDKATLFTYGHPVMRLEVTLADECAASWWRIWRQDPDQAAGVMAAHLVEITGFRVAEPRSIPVPETEPEVDQAQRVFRFIEQNASMILAARHIGIDVVDLAEHRMTHSSRKTKLEHMKRVAEMARLRADRVMAVVHELIEIAEWTRREARA
jgi:hypothetical protein